VSRGYSAGLRDGIPLVSSHGRVKSTYNVIHWGSLTRAGYRVTSIGGQTMRVHRLVAYAFLGQQPSMSHCEVNHKDGNRQNNHVSNLEFATRSQNVKHSFDTNPKRRTAAETFSKPVIGRLHGTHTWTLYPSMSEASRELNVHVSSVCLCCQKTFKQISGYEFQYAYLEADEILPGEVWHMAREPVTGVLLPPWMVSSYGRVQSSRTRSWESDTGAGYRKVRIRLDGKHRDMFVHRIVARTSLGAPPSPEQAYVNHKDGNGCNNCVSNLEYVTRSENLQHAYAQGRSRVQAALCKPLFASHRTGDDWSYFPSIAAAVKELSISQACISKALRGTVREHLNYRFRSAPREDVPILPGEEWRKFKFA